MADVLFGVVLVFIVISTIYDDIRCGLIRNARVLQGLAAGAIIYFVIVLASFFQDSLSFLGPLLGEHDRDIFWFLRSLLNTAIGFIVACVLWHFKVWAAGDAKLFTLYCFLVPSDLYRATDVPFFPGIILLINIFTFTFLYLFIDAAAGTVKKLTAFAKDAGKADIERKIAEFPRLLWTWAPLILMYTVMFAGIRAMRTAARESLAPYVNVSEFTLYIILFVAFKPLSALARRTWGAVVFTVVSLGAVAYLVFVQGIDGIGHILQPGGFAVLFVVFARVYQKLGNVSKAITIGQLRPGMILAKETQAALDALVEKEKKEAQEKGEMREDDDDEKEEEPGTESVPRKLGAITVDGLTSEQVRFIKTRFKDDEEILMAQTIPFSPILAIGALTTFWAGRILIRVLFK